ncbi:MAG TPA: hypothetical protein VGX23_14935 [Actinocrinis sp.]|nr:hypothetical protein [Actinocrinis sp.]
MAVAKGAHQRTTIAAGRTGSRVGHAAAEPFFGPAEKEICAGFRPCPRPHHRTLTMP